MPPVVGDLADRLGALGWVHDLHRELDRTAAAGLALGCVYVDQDRLLDRTAAHPTWTHGAWSAGSCPE